MRPDILAKREDSLRRDVRVLADGEYDVVKEILTEQGLFKHGEPTIVYDRVANPGLADLKKK
jgi:hypothetical protein